MAPWWWYVKTLHQNEVFHGVLWAKIGNMSNISREKASIWEESVSSFYHWSKIIPELSITAHTVCRFSFILTSFKSYCNLVMIRWIKRYRSKLCMKQENNTVIEDSSVKIQTAIRPFCEVSFHWGTAANSCWYLSSNSCPILFFFFWKHWGEN